MEKLPSEQRLKPEHIQILKTCIEGNADNNYGNGVIKLHGPGIYVNYAPYYDSFLVFDKDEMRELWAKGAKEYNERYPFLKDLEDWGLMVMVHYSSTGGFYEITEAGRAAYETHLEAEQRKLNDIYSKMVGKDER